MIKKCAFVVILTFMGLVIFAQKAENLSFQKDSIIDSKLGIIYNYKFYKNESEYKKLLYSYQTETVSIIDSFRFINLNLDYYSFILYDEPTGRVFALVYNYKNKSLYKSTWFDDKAKGDYLIKDKINFAKRYIIIKEKDLNKFYIAKLTTIR